MKDSILFWVGVFGLFVLNSCSEPVRRVAQGTPYTLSGTLWQDSARVDSTVSLIIDRHEVSFSLDGDSIPSYEVLELPVVEGRFFYQGKAPVDADELYLYDQHGNVARMYGTSGAALSVEVLQDGTIRQGAVDTTELLKVILLRDSIVAINDSIKVRRLLGGFSDASKPEWLLRSINLLLDQKSRRLGKSVRMPRMDLPLEEGAYSLLGNRQETLLMLFWSKDWAASEDSLKMFDAIARDYGLYQYADSFEKDKSKSRRPKAHRIELLSICLQTSDSAAWKSSIQDVPGKHVWLQGGWAHPLVTACCVRNLPAVVVVDRYGNYQSDNVWGEALYRCLDKAPYNSEVNKRLLK